MYNALGQCNICKKEYTSLHVTYDPGIVVYVCPTCMEKAKDNFIWLCMNCGQSYIRPKKLVLSRLEQSGLENASLLCEGIQLVLGIEMCIACNPEGIVEYMKERKAEVEYAL
jgi:hypothetical protein